MVRSLAIREGFFRVDGDPAVFYSNGINAYCWVPNPRYHIDYEVALHQINVHNATSFRRDGICPGMHE